jgi:hypothetical protein
MKPLSSLSCRSAIWRLWVGGLLLAGTAALSAGDWQSLLGNSPFGQTSAAPAGNPSGDPEFRGVVEEEGIYLVNLYQPGTKTAQWVPVPGRVPGLQVEAYDAVAQQVRITLAGRALVLPLKLARVSLVGHSATRQLIDPVNPPAAEEVAGLPEFMRNLPPEARRLLEDVRRRRAIRDPFPGPAPAGNPPATPPGGVRPDPR